MEKASPPTNNCTIPWQRSFPFQQRSSPFSHPLLFVIPSEAEGSAVRHSAEPNLSFYNHFPFVILSDGRDLRFSSSASAVVESETADPSASLGMTKRRGWLKGEDRCQGIVQLLVGGDTFPIDNRPFVRNQKTHGQSTEGSSVSVHQLGVDVATLWLRQGCP
jgi:hypothetical protein